MVGKPAEFVAKGLEHETGVHNSAIVDEVVRDFMSKFDEAATRDKLLLEGPGAKEFWAALDSGPTANEFCPTGPGGGVDPTCSPSGSGGSKVPDNVPKDFKLTAIGKDAKADAKDTEEAYTAHGGYISSRVREVHDPIIKAALANVPKSGHPTLYMTGGGWGSGKSTLLDKFPEVVGFPKAGAAVRSDPDALKAGIPEYQKYASPGPYLSRAAPSYVHEESSHIAKEIVKSGLANGMDVVYDTSGDSGIAKLADKVGRYRAAGAVRVEANYAFPGSVKEAQSRADRRAKNSGGLRRYVEPAALAANHRDVAKTWFDAADRGTFDKLTLWNTDHPMGQPPTLVASAAGGKITVYDRAVFNKFKDLAGR